MPDFNVRQYNWVLVQETYAIEARSRNEALMKAAADPYGETHFDTRILDESSCLQSWEAVECFSHDDPLLVSAKIEPPVDTGRLTFTRTGYLGVRRS